MKIIRTKRHSRIFKVTGLGPEGSSSLEILINYLGDSNAEKGCLLDGEVIPQLLEALEGRMEVEGENTDDDDQII